MKRHFDVPQDATPISDCSGLIPVWVRTSHDLNRMKAENILKAQRKYLKRSHPKNWFHPEELKAVHHAMFKEVWGLGKTSIENRSHLLESNLA